MWFQILLMFLAASSVMSDIESEIGQCVEAAGDKPFALSNLKSRELHGALCSLIHDFVTCLQGVAQNQLGLSLEELLMMMYTMDVDDAGNENMIEVIANTLEVIEDVCTEGTELNTAIMAGIDCLDTMEDPSYRCAVEGRSAYEVFSGFVDNAEDEIEDEKFSRDRTCMLAAYESACLAASIHEACGRRAFDIYNTVVKRTSIFKNGLCSEQALENLKTTFIESLEMGEEERKIFGLALDLKKRRK